VTAGDERIARRIRVRGRVQGVGYRAWTVDVARGLGLDGWVRNRLNGSVEILAVGPAPAVDALIDRCRQGPPAARVDALDSEAALGIVASGFTPKPTV